MPRKKRIWHPDVFNHIVSRGNNRQNIFLCDRDYIEFFRVLSYTYEKYPFIITSFCLMSNHYHLLLQSPEVPIGKVMRIINHRYGDYFRKKYHYTGHLYEKRYYSELITTPNSMIRVSRYIHRNPINTTTPIVHKLEHYRYSSYAFYKHNQPCPYPFFDTKPLYDCFIYPFLQTKEHYILYCETNIEDEMELTLKT